MGKIKKVQEPMRIYTLTNNTKLRLHKVVGILEAKDKHVIECQEGLVTIPVTSILFFRVAWKDEG